MHLGLSLSMAQQRRAASGEATAPAQVGTVTATPGDTQVTLAWSAPSNGGSAITDYVIQYRPAIGGEWTTFADGTSTATTAIVTGLTNDTSYSFRVAAVNAIGTGTASVAVPSTPVAGSQVPLAELTLSGNTATLADAPISGWTYTLYREGGTSVGTLNSGNSYSLSITGNAKTVYCIATKSGQADVTGPSYIPTNTITYRDTDFATADDVADLKTTAYLGLQAADTGMHGIVGGQLVAIGKASGAEKWLPLALTGGGTRLQCAEWPMLWATGIAGPEDYRSMEINYGGASSIKVVYKQGFAQLYRMYNGGASYTSLGTATWTSPMPGETAKLHVVKVGSTIYYKFYAGGTERISADVSAFVGELTGDQARFGLHPQMSTATADLPYPSTTSFYLYSAPQTFYFGLPTVTAPTRAASGSASVPIYYQGTVANAEIAAVDRATRRVLTTYTSHATGGSGSFTPIKTLADATAGYKNVALIVRNAADHSQADELDLGDTYWMPVYDTVPGINMARASASTDVDFFTNRALVANYQYSDLAVPAADDYDNNGYPKGNRLPGVPMWLKLFENAATGARWKNQTLVVTGLSGSTFTTPTGSWINASNPRYDAGTGTLLIDIGSADFTFCFLTFTGKPTGGFAGIDARKASEASRTQLMSAEYINDWGYHPTLRPDRPRSGRVMKCYRGEELTWRNNLGTFLPQGGPAFTPYNLAQIAYEMGWTELQIAGPIDMTDDDIQSICEGVASNTNWTGTFKIALGNEISWNMSFYAITGDWLMKQALDEGYHAGLAAGATYTKEYFYSWQGARTKIDYNGDVIAPIAADDIICAYCNGSGDGKYLLLKAKVPLNVGAPRINPSALIAGGGDSNWTCLGDTNTLYFAADRWRLVRTAQVYDIGVSILGSRFETVFEDSNSQSASQMFAKLSVTDLSGNPVHSKIKNLTRNPYLFQIFNIASAGDLSYLPNGLIADQQAQVDATYGPINNLIREAQGLARLCYQAHGNPGPRVGVYEGGSSILSTNTSGGSVSDATIQASWKPTFETAGWQTLTYNQCAKLLGAGLGTINMFVDAQYPRLSGSGQFEAFGFQFETGGTTAKAIIGYRQAIADWN